VRLWQDTGRGHDQYGLQVACDAAASTAYHIVSQREMEESQGGLGVGFGAGSYRDRRSSFGAFPTPGYAGSGGYGGGGSVYGGSSMGGGSPLLSPMGMGGAQPIPVPGSPYAAMGGGGYAGSMGSFGGLPSSYGGHVGSYGSYGGSPGYDVGGLQVGYPMGAGLGGYASLPSSPQTIIIPPPEGRRSRHRHHHHHRRHRSHDRY
jgi:hypothetical protein